MRLRNRFGLVGLGVILFLVITPALVLYARGFKIDWENKSFVKTGALVVKTEPEKADIYINDEKYSADTPANIRFLLPGDYNIRIEKPGYQSWTKRLAIKSQLVTWVNFNRDFITLFRTNPNNVKRVTIKNATVSKTNEEIIYVTDSGLGLIDIDRDEDKTLLNVNNLQLPILNSEIKWQNSTQVISIFANKPNLNLLETKASTIKKLETDRSNIVIQTGSELYYLKSGNLNLIDKNISNFSLNDDLVWYIQDRFLKSYNLSNGKYETTFDDLPLATESQIIRTLNQIYLILNQTLYRFNGGLEQINTSVKYAYWNDQSNELLFANDHEIYLFNPNTKDSNLIVRSLTTVNDAVLNRETGYIFYQNEGKIKAIELDERDHRNIFTITDAMNKFVISRDGKKLYTIADSEIRLYEIR